MIFLLSFLDLKFSFDYVVFHLFLKVFSFCHVNTFPLLKTACVYREISWFFHYLVVKIVICVICVAAYLYSFFSFFFLPTLFSYFILYYTQLKGNTSKVLVQLLLANIIPLSFLLACEHLISIWALRLYLLVFFPCSMHLLYINHCSLCLMILVWMFETCHSGFFHTILYVCAGDLD